MLFIYDGVNYFAFYVRFLLKSELYAGYANVALTVRA